MNIGDIVEILGHYDSFLERKKGRIVCTGHRDYGVEFDDHIGGHDCEGHAREGHGWYVPERYLRVIKTNKINLTKYEEV